VLLKSLAGQENRHPESPLWGEGSALITSAAGRPIFLYPCIPVYLFQKTNPIFSRPNMYYRVKNAEIEAKKLDKKTKRTQFQKASFCKTEIFLKLPS